MAWRFVLALTTLASGRAMTIAFIGRAGDGGPGDPPEAWLMPLIGDAVIGVSAIVVALLIWRRPNPTTWVLAVIWNAIGAFDALAAYVVEVSAPWPEFFMLELVGRSMFFAAAIMHLALIGLLSRPEVLTRFGLSRPIGSAGRPDQATADGGTGSSPAHGTL